MFNQYVKTRTQDNFKFWIVSFSDDCPSLFILFFPYFFGYVHRVQELNDAVEQIKFLVIFVSSAW